MLKFKDGAYSIWLHGSGKSKYRLEFYSAAKTVEIMSYHKTLKEAKGRISSLKFRAEMIFLRNIFQYDTPGITNEKK